MSTVVDVARGIMAVMQPETGDRAAGSVKIITESGNVTIDRNTFLVPILGGRHRPDLVFKVGEGPNSDKSWTVTQAGVSVNVLSNIGGARHNIASGTSFVFDPPLVGISSVVNSADISGGVDPTGFGGILSMVMYEQFGGPSQMLELARSQIRAFPSVIVAWSGSEPADGSGTSQVSQRTKTGVSATLFREFFDIYVIAARSESDHIRRQEGLAILDMISRRLINRRGVDGGQPISNPSGLQIRGRFRLNGPQDIYQKFYIYGLRTSAMVAYSQCDDRTVPLWMLASIDITKPQKPALPNQGDLTVVDDMQVDMNDQV